MAQEEALNQFSKALLAIAEKTDEQLKKLGTVENNKLDGIITELNTINHNLERLLSQSPFIQSKGDFGVEKNKLEQQVAKLNSIIHETIHHNASLKSSNQAIQKLQTDVEEVKNTIGSPKR